MKKSRIKSMKYLQSIFNISIQNNKQLDTKSEGISKWSFWLADIRWILKRNSCWFYSPYILVHTRYMRYCYCLPQVEKVIGFLAISALKISFPFLYHMKDDWAKNNYWSTILMGYKFNIEIGQILRYYLKDKIIIDKWLVSISCVCIKKDFNNFPSNYWNNNYKYSMLLLEVVVTEFIP
jgi:hypothetical protein